MITKMAPSATGNVRGSLWCSGILILLVFFTASCDGRTMVRMTTSETESLNDLSQDSYLPPLNSSKGQIMYKEALSEAKSVHQSNVKIRSTGCGINDKRRVPRNSQWQEYKLWGNHRWNKIELTYKILDYPKGLQREAVDKEIKKAFNMWAEHTVLTGKQIFDGKADIVISFKERISTKEYPNKLALSSHPGDDCWIKFDAPRTWTINSDHGKNLLQVATHEFGHTLGIHHSEVKSAVMWPKMLGYNPNFKLHIDDIKAIQRLYGAKSRG